MQQERYLTRYLTKKFGTKDFEELNALWRLGDNSPKEIKELREFVSKIMESGTYTRNLKTITSKRELIELLRVKYSFDYESFGVVFLKADNGLIKSELIGRGTLDRQAVYTRELAKKCLLYNAKSVIIFHNHPSGKVTPSKSDIQLTREVKEALKLLEIRVLDHIIVSDTTSYSFIEEGVLEWD